MKQKHIKIITFFFLITFLMQYFTILYGYENHCWKCKTHISSSKDTRCSICNWYICSKCDSCMPQCERLDSDTSTSSNDNSTFALIIFAFILILFIGPYYYLSFPILDFKKDKKPIKNNIDYKNINIQKEYENIQKKNKELENERLIAQKQEQIKEEKIKQYHNRLKNKEDRENLIKLLQLHIEKQTKNSEEIKSRLKYVLEQKNYPLNETFISLIIQYYKFNPLEEIEELLIKNKYQKQINPSNNIIWVKYK